MIEAKSDAIKSKYCIGTWNVKSMNQGKLQVVKQEMARGNVDILDISNLKWIGMHEFNSDEHYIQSHHFMESRWGNSVRLFWGSKITGDGDCGHEIKRRLLLGRIIMTNIT